MAEFINFKITLSRWEADRYLVEAQYDNPLDETLRESVRGMAEINLHALRVNLLNADAYSSLISEAVFKDEEIKSYFLKASALAQDNNKVLRLRLVIDRSALELHNLRWEMLCDPDTGKPLAVTRDVLFSRFLASQDWEPIQLRPKSRLRALIVIANPVDLANGKYQVEVQPIPILSIPTELDQGSGEVERKTLPEVDVPAELERARQGLSDVYLDELVSDPAAPGNVTLEKILDKLHNGYDILYLVCHGVFRAKQKPPGTYLWLEDDQGNGAIVAGELLADRIQNIPSNLRPQMVMLVSCQSAGDGGVMQAWDSQGALAALGPRLIQAGVPAVIAMHGSITMQTAEKFLPAFFNVLNEDGQLDLAMSSARSSISERPDWWMPVLYMRLREGRIWYEAGFAGEKDETKWNSLKGSVKNKKCTFILGPGLLDPIIGNQREIARLWAESHGYPLSDSDKEELPRIAQFLSRIESTEYVHTTAYQEAIRRELTRRYGDLLTDEQRDADDWSLEELSAILKTVIDSIWNDENPGPYQLLARLEQKIYITANTSLALEDALNAAGKFPVTRLCPWNDLIPLEECIYTEEPSIEKPLVYHLFGRMDLSDSIVLTEDDYFDYLIGITKNKQHIPSDVQDALVRYSLVFLGFRIDDWQFRVFFRMIMNLEGKDLLIRSTHAAAQIEPQENRIQDLERAREYLAQYFQFPSISLYQGSALEFLQSLVNVVEGKK